MSGGPVMYRGGAERTGVTGTPGPPAGFVPWGRWVHGPVLCSPAVADGMVYVADAGGRLTALDAVTGARQWFVDPPGGERLITTPVVRAGTVYLAAGQADGLLALDAATGGQRWSFPTGLRMSAPPAVTDELVFLVASGSGEEPTGPRLVALRASDGRQVWDRQLGGLKPDMLRLVREMVETGGRPEFCASPPAVAGDSVYLTGPDGAIYAVAISNGKVRWKVEVGAGRHSGCTVAGDLVFVSGDRGLLFALSTSDGAQQWSVETRLQPNRVLPVVIGDLVYVAGRAVSELPPWLTSGAVMAYEAATGERRWRRPTAAWVEASPAVGHGRLIFATRGTAQNDAELTAVDAGDGRVLWRRLIDHRSLHPTDTRDDGIRSALVIHNGVIYLGLPKGSVTSLDAATGTGMENRFKRWRVRLGWPVGRQPSPVMAHLQTVAWAAPVVLLSSVVAMRVGWSPLAGLAGWLPLIAAAQLFAWVMFHMGVRFLHRDWPVTAAVLSGLSLAAMMLVPPVRRLATHRVVAIANVASAFARADLPHRWRCASNTHVSMAEHLAARFPAAGTIALRAQANVMAAKGCQLFGDRAEAARYAAHALDLYLAIDAFFDPELKYQARHADAIYCELTGTTSTNC